MNNHEIAQARPMGGNVYQYHVDIPKLQEVINELVQRIEELERKVNE